MTLSEALAARAGKRDFSGFAADLVIVDPSGAKRRWEVGGARGIVRVAFTGSVAGQPRTSEAGFREGPVDVANLAALAQALGKLPLDTMHPPAKPGPGAILRVFSGNAGLLAAVPEARLASVVEAFEAVSAAAKPQALVRLELTLSGGDEWQGEARLVNAGTLPIVVRHPGALFAAKMLVLERAGKPANLAPKAPAPSHAVLAPGASVAAVFASAPLPGDGAVRLAWKHPAPTLDARFGEFDAPEGVLASAEVRV